MTRKERAAFRRLPLAAMLRDIRRWEDRRAARRFLARAVRRGNNDHAVLGGDLGNAHRRALWFVVVTASHKSGTFEGQRKPGKGAKR